MIVKYLGGIFLGWGLGANNSANVFGTAVASRMVKYRLAVLLIAFFVIIGAYAQGAGGIETLSTITKHTEKSAIICSLAAAITVIIMTLMKLPISTSQAVVGAIIGIGALKTAPEGEKLHLASLLKIVICWVGTPIGGALFAVLFYLLFKALIKKYNPTILQRGTLIKTGLIVCGAYGAYALGANNVANVTAVFVGSGMLSVTQATVLGGITIAAGALTYAKPVMMTVGEGMVKLDPFCAFIAVLANAVTVHIYAMIGVPVSSSQAIVGAVIGIGVLKGLQTVKFNAVLKIFVGWLMTPILGAVIAMLIYFFAHLEYTG